MKLPFHVIYTTLEQTCVLAVLVLSLFSIHTRALTQVVGVKNRDNPDWWMAALDNGVEGWVPANYLEMQ